MKRFDLPSFAHLQGQAKKAWSNRQSLIPLCKVYLNDDLHPWSVKLIRRLLARGHAASARSISSIDHAGQPLPWYPYCLCDYLEDLDVASWHVVEIGTGSSTLYWSRKCSSVIALEHNPAWHAKMLPEVPPNVSLLLGENETSLRKAKEMCSTPQLVVIDGHSRAEVTKQCLRLFGCAPLYLVDNSDWLPKTTQVLRDAGLVEIRFKGPGAANTFHWSASLFTGPQSLGLLSRIATENRVAGGLPAGDWEQQNAAITA
jgi:hypothetical protein